MATIRRDTAPAKGKTNETLSAPRTVLTKTNPNSTTPSQRRRATSNLRPTLSSTKDDVSKQQQVTKPISTLSIHKPTLTTRSRPTLEKSTPSTQKTRPSINPSLRSSSSLISSRTSAAQKPVPGKNLKAVVTKDQAEKPRSLMHATPPVATTTIKKSSTGLKKKETGNTTLARKQPIRSATPLKSVRSQSVSKVRKPENLPKNQKSSITAAEQEKKVLIPSSNEKGKDDHAEKRHPLQTIPVNSTVKKSNDDIKKQETENNTSPAKEEITTTTPESVEIPDLSRVPEPEMKPEHQESSVTAADQEQIVQVSNNDEKGTDEFVPESQEPLKIEETEGETKEEDTKVVSDEASTVLENQDAPLVIQTQESETKPHVEENKEDSIEETDSSNTDQSLAENPNEAAEEKHTDEVEVLAVVEEKKEEVTQVDAKDEVVTESAHHESKETEEQVVVEEVKQQEPEKAAPKQNQVTQGKKDSAVSSNHVIKETASKLREQRQNRVKALAGAFETVISLQ